MADGVDPPKADVEEASSRLDEGLKSCRSVVRNYRAMLGNPPVPDMTAPAADQNAEKPDSADQ